MNDPLQILNKLKNLHESLLDLDKTLKFYEDKYMIPNHKIISKEQITENKDKLSNNYSDNKLMSKKYVNIGSAISR